MDRSNFPFLPLKLKRTDSVCHKFGSSKQPIPLHSLNVCANFDYYLSVFFCKRKKHQLKETSAKKEHELNVTENSPSWINQLNVHGYAVVPNVLAPPQCDHIIDKAWEWLAALGTGIQRNDSSAWANDRWPRNFNGIIQRYRIGHAPFVWQARTNSNVIGVFEKIWGTNELLTSFDAIGILRPVEMVSDLEHTSSWFHTDQSPKKEGLHCVQGVLNLEEVCRLS